MNVLVIDLFTNIFVIYHIVYKLYRQAIHIIIYNKYIFIHSIPILI